MLHPLAKLPEWNDRVFLGNTQEGVMWREKTPEEKLLSKIPKENQKGAKLFISAVQKTNPK